MSSISRRGFFRNSAAGAAIAGFLAAERQADANPLGLPIGSQTYPHRQRIKDGDFAGLCTDMKKLGVGQLELCSPGYREFAGLADAKQTAKVIADHGLKSPSSHFGLRELRDKLPESIAWAHDLGMTQMGTASLNGPAPNGVAAMDTIKRLAEEYNKVGEQTAQAGIQAFLHDERFEMAKAEDGRVVYQVLLELLDPKLVKMQFQMSAMRAVGDPVMYFNKYPGRFLSMHLQGVDLKAPAEARGPQVAVGKDSLNWKKIFGAAKKGGVKNYFVELPWEQTVESVAYLKKLKA